MASQCVSCNLALDLIFLNFILVVSSVGSHLLARVARPRMAQLVPSFLSNLPQYSARCWSHIVKKKNSSVLFYFCHDSNHEMRQVGLARGEAPTLPHSAPKGKTFSHNSVFRNTKSRKKLQARYCNSHSWEPVTCRALSWRLYVLTHIISFNLHAIS